MQCSIRVVGIIALIFAVHSPAGAQELAPPGAGVSIRKLSFDTASTHTVKYYVQGGSPRLQALVRRVEWTENELSVVEQMQLLKLETVVQERRAAAYRAAQITNPFFPTGFYPHSYGYGSGCDYSSPLQRTLAGQLAYEATPQAALQLIGYLEVQQTLLDAELKALPPPEKKAAQDPIDALRPRLAALPRAEPPQLPQPLNAVAIPQKARVSAMEVKWQGTWWPAEVVKTNGNQSYIHYTGWGDNWNEWVGPDRIRTAAARP